MSVDRCGVCGGDGQGCNVELRCNARQGCLNCTGRIEGGIAKGGEYCFWCDGTSTCHDLRNLNDTTYCNVSSSIKVCPSESVPPVEGTFDTVNQDDNEIGSLIIPIVTALGVVLAVCGMLLMRQHKRRGAGLVEVDLLPDHGYFNFFNPLYTSQGIEKENPLYVSASDDRFRVDQDENDNLVLFDHSNASRVALQN